jgi:enoyl-CoA hydratase/carnithine racemase
MLDYMSRKRVLMELASNVEVERHPLAVDGAVAAFVVLNRPEKLNALDWTTIIELEASLHLLDMDSEVRAIFITGRGRAFSAGGDLNSYIELQRDPVRFPAFLTDLHRTFADIAAMTKPVVALVNGVTAAGGLELMLSCDLAYAADDAKIGDGHLNFGQIGGGGSLALLPRAIGPAKARELVFRGGYLTAAEAADLGLVNKVVPARQLHGAGLELASSIASHSAAAIEASKSVLNTGWTEGTDLPMALRLERERAALYCLTLPDSMEGLIRFASRSHDHNVADPAGNGSGDGSPAARVVAAPLTGHRSGREKRR